MDLEAEKIRNKANRDARAADINPESLKPLAFDAARTVHAVSSPKTLAQSLIARENTPEVKKSLWRRLLSIPPSLVIDPMALWGNNGLRSHGLDVEANPARLGAPLPDKGMKNLVNKINTQHAIDDKNALTRRLQILSDNAVRGTAAVEQAGIAWRDAERRQDLALSQVANDEIDFTDALPAVEETVTAAENYAKTLGELFKNDNELLVLDGQKPMTVEASAEKSSMEIADLKPVEVAALPKAPPAAILVSDTLRQQQRSDREFSRAVVGFADEASARDLHRVMQEHGLEPADWHDAVKLAASVSLYYPANESYAAKREAFSKNLAEGLVLAKERNLDTRKMNDAQVFSDPASLAFVARVVQESRDFVNVAVGSLPGPQDAEVILTARVWIKDNRPINGAPAARLLKIGHAVNLVKPADSSKMAAWDALLKT